MKAASIIAVALLLTGAALAQWQPPNNCESGCESGCETGGWGGSPLLSQQSRPQAQTVAHPSVCQVWVIGDPLPGTGVLIDKDGDVALIATVKHIADLSDDLVVRFPDNVDRRVTNKYTDKEGWDLAILECSAPAASVVPIAETAPAPGAVVTVHGWGGRRYSARSGRVKTYARPKTREIGRGRFMRFAPTMPLDDLIVSVVSVSGDSGGPIFNQQGQIVAILSCTDQRTESAGACCRPLSGFLARVRARRCPLPPAPIVVDIDLPIPPAEPVPAPTADPCAGLLVRIEKLESRTPIPGEQGLQGDPDMDGQQGDQGPQGDPGKALVVADLTDEQIQQLADRLVPVLPPFTVRAVNTKTGVEQHEEVRLGGGFTIQLNPQ